MGPRSKRNKSLLSTNCSKTSVLSATAVVTSALPCLATASAGPLPYTGYNVFENDVFTATCQSATEHGEAVVSGGPRGRGRLVPLHRSINEALLAAVSTALATVVAYIMLLCFRDVLKGDKSHKARVLGDDYLAPDLCVVGASSLGAPPAKEVREIGPRLSSSVKSEPFTSEKGGNEELKALRLGGSRKKQDGQGGSNRASNPGSETKTSPRVCTQKLKPNKPPVPISGKSSDPGRPPLPARVISGQQHGSSGGDGESVQSSKKDGTPGGKSRESSVSTCHSELYYGDGSIYYGGDASECEYTGSEYTTGGSGSDIYETESSGSGDEGNLYTYGDTYMQHDESNRTGHQRPRLVTVVRKSVPSETVRLKSARKNSGRKSRRKSKIQLPPAPRLEESYEHVDVYNVYEEIPAAVCVKPPEINEKDLAMQRWRFKQKLWWMVFALALALLITSIGLYTTLAHEVTGYAIIVMGLLISGIIALTCLPYREAECRCYP